MESNNGLTFSQESFITYRKDGEIVAIEEQLTGLIVRYATKAATRQQSLEILGADKPIRI